MQDVHGLGNDLSMLHANAELRARYADSATPYRDMLQEIRKRLNVTLQWTEARLHGRNVEQPEGLITSREDLLEPLMLCYNSLRKVGLPHIANGPLIDTIHPVHSFGINLVPLDILQDGQRHLQVLHELTESLGRGLY